MIAISYRSRGEFSNIQKNYAEDDHRILTANINIYYYHCVLQVKLARRHYVHGTYAVKDTHEE